MAREQRHDVDYFPHPCSHGRKMHIIESKYGNDGYAVWIKLLEQLGKANYHFIDISNNMNFMYLVSIFKVEMEKANEILNDLAELEAIDKNLFKNYKILYSEKFVNSIEDAYKKRKSAPLSPEEILDKLNLVKIQSGAETNESAAETNISTSETPQKGSNPPESILKEKKRKEKKRKGEKNARENFEKISSSYELIKKQKPEQLSAFEMQKKIQVLDWKKVISSFDTKMELEISQDKIEFESEQLFPRFKGYVNTWIDNDLKKLENRNHGTTQAKPEYF
ncbi:DUF4373 domain-containing protein [uncultured Christiangramia sp.]|uniref:DUF4373 domain-containing protein n=1 Tax=uncultured Christiangramia sp. TaxID=503836 RepID=UPI002639909B|nr:DUF4373 domain-containing protein [uncultured Christiangramia sp.]